MSVNLPPCDLVMKGGVTSGVVYPRLVTRLARSYRFASIGGASAGAIAAAMTAAAEYERGRRASGIAPAGDGPAGFALLHDLPDALGGRIGDLFVPAPGLRHHLSALQTAVDARGPARFWGALRHALVAAPGPLVVVGLVGLVLALGLAGAVLGTGGAWWAATLAGVVVLLLAALVAAGLAAWRFVRTGLAGIEANGFGLVRGVTDPGSGRAPGGALTEWVADTLDATAGLPPGEVLTYGHLWGPEAVAAHRALKLGSADATVDPERLDAFRPDIDLQMMTTCLSLRRPYVFPFGTRIFHWCPDCWSSWFPPRVVDVLVTASAPARPHRQRIDGEPTLIPDRCPHHPATQLRSLPDAPDMPVVVGVRLSLSFPGLISAVPAFVLDRYRTEGNWGYREVWFSDGGLTSNFPLEFFDTPLPTRPTFGVTLEDPHPDTDAPAFRPEHNKSGILGRVRPIAGAGDFVGAIIGVLVDWRDALTVPAAGNRDRVVEVRLPRGAGGLHLTMDAATIADIAARGEAGAAALETFDWDNHRWIRYRTATAGLGDALHATRRNWGSYPELLDRPEPPSYPVGRGREDDDRAATSALLETADTWAALGNPAHSGSLPSPRRVLKETPSA